MRILHAAIAALALASLGGAAAQASVIIAPVSVTVTSGGTVGSFWAVDNVINQSGLSVGYTPVVTSFEDYLALKPTHSGALNTEWFSGQEARSARLTFDFGKEVTLFKLALWDENNSDQVAMSISTPAQGPIFSFSPTESREAGYGASPAYQF